MKAYVKKVIDAHNFYTLTKRQAQNKVPKSSGDRKGTKTAKRMADKAAMLKET